MREEGHRQAGWEILQDFAEELGPHGSELRRGIDQATLNKWVEELAPWSVFATFTFAREGVSVAGAQRAFERFARRYFKGCPVIYYIEHNPTRGDGGHHIHAMIACGNADRRSRWEAWFKSQGVCRLEPIRNSGEVAAYCSKLSPYVTKSHNKGGLWWNVLNCRRVWQEVVQQQRRAA